MPGGLHHTASFLGFQSPVALAVRAVKERAFFRRDRVFAAPKASLTACAASATLDGTRDEAHPSSARQIAKLCLGRGGAVALESFDDIRFGNAGFGGGIAMHAAFAPRIGGNEALEAGAGCRR